MPSSSAAELPEDRPVGIRAKKSPEAIALILACLQARAALPAAVGRAGARDARQAVRAGGRRAACSTPARPAQRQRAACARSRRRRAEERGAVAVAAGRRRRRHLVHAHHLGLDRAAEGRAAAGRRRRPLHRLGRRAVRHRARARSSPTTRRSTSTSACSTSGRRSSTAAASRWSTRTGRPTAPTSPTCSPTNEVNVAPGGADALPPADRRDARGRPQLPERQARDHDRRQDPADARSRQLPGLFPNARFFNIYGCTETNDSLIHEFEGLADGDVPDERPGRASRCPASRTLIQTDDGAFLDGTGTGELLVWTPFQTRGYLNAALNEEQVRAASRGRRRRDDLLPDSGDIVRRHDDGVAHASRAAPTSTSRSAASGSARRSSSRRSRSTRT